MVRLMLTLLYIEAAFLGNCEKGGRISIPSEALGGRLFGGLRPCFCSVGFAIRLLFKLNP